jgi:hypothetical protein
MVVCVHYHDPAARHHHHVAGHGQPRACCRATVAAKEPDAHRASQRGYDASRSINAPDYAGFWLSNVHVAGAVERDRGGALDSSSGGKLAVTAA